MKPASLGSTVRLLGLTLLLAGCEEDVVAVLGTEQPYTMWGVLNPLADVQYVRVFAIEGTLNTGAARPLDARFTSVDLDTGEEQVWRDSVLVDERGIVGHVFYAPFRAQYEHAYRLRIQGGGGATSTVEVEVPVRTSLTLDEPDTTQGVLLRGRVPSGPPRLVRSELSVGASYVNGFTEGGCPLYQFLETTLPYDERVRAADDGWRFTVNLAEMYRLFETRAAADPFYLRQHGVTLGYLRFDTIVANEAWAPPDGNFDPNVLAQPGTMSNVENGFGFVGAGYRLARSWTLLPRVVERSGFRSDYVSCR